MASQFAASLLANDFVILAESTAGSNGCVGPAFQPTARTGEHPLARFRSILSQRREVDHGRQRNAEFCSLIHSACVRVQRERHDIIRLEIADEKEFA